MWGVCGDLLPKTPPPRAIKRPKSGLKHLKNASKTASGTPEYAYNLTNFIASAIGRSLLCPSQPFAGPKPDAKNSFSATVTCSAQHQSFTKVHFHERRIYQPV
jgi:hypothetical protein